MKTHVLKMVLIISLAFLQLSFTTNSTENEKLKKQTIKVALLLDTSGSMNGLIKPSKSATMGNCKRTLLRKMWAQKKPNLEIALYEYGNDRLASRKGYIRKVLHFSNDLDEISERLFSLTTNGGSEYCGQVIQTSLNELEWGKNKRDLKMIFIAGNEPFTQGKINYKDAITNAKEKNITIKHCFLWRL